MYLLKAKKLHDKEVMVEYEAEKKERRAQRRQRRKERTRAREAAKEGEWQDMDFNCRYMGSFQVRIHDTSFAYSCSMRATCSTPPSPFRPPIIFPPPNHNLLPNLTKPLTSSTPQTQNRCPPGQMALSASPRSNKASGRCES